MTDNKMTTEQMLDWLDEELKWYYRQNIGPEIELNRRIWAVKSISTFIQSSTAERERLRNACVEAKNYLLTKHNLGRVQRAKKRLEISQMLSNAICGGKQQ